VYPATLKIMLSIELTPPLKPTGDSIEKHVRGLKNVVVITLFVCLENSCNEGEISIVPPPQDLGEKITAEFQTFFQVGQDRVAIRLLHFANHPVTVLIQSPSITQSNCLFEAEFIDSQIPPATCESVLNEYFQ
jgi:hypothetical protein